MARIEEGTEITTHQRLLTLQPPPKFADGTSFYRETCGGTMLAEPDDKGRGPVIVRCDECGDLRGLKRPDPQTELVLSGAGIQSDWG